jgi:Na+/proline symporter
MRRSVTPLIIAASLGALCSAPALAYIGPGAGITMLGALWGVVIAIALAIGAVLLWPIRILFRRRRKGTAECTDETMAEMSEAETSEAETSKAGEGE